VYVLGFGNPAREDDGIGPAIVEALEHEALPGVTLDANYQLSVEDAAEIAEHDVVIFVDASVDETAEPVAFEPVEPTRGGSFSTHSVLPGDVLGMAHDRFGSQAEAYLLSVRGYSFEMFTEEMTAGARANTERATRLLLEMLTTRDFKRFAGGSS
jgi:hydrogenase maturation protease